jgi:hypothetical protein
MTGKSGERVNLAKSVIPAQAGTQHLNKQTPLRDFTLQGLGPGLRRDDGKWCSPDCPDLREPWPEPWGGDKAQIKR